MASGRLRMSVLALVGVVLPFACSVNTAGEGSGQVTHDSGASGASGGAGAAGAGGVQADAGDDQQLADAGAAGSAPDGSIDAPVEAPQEACAPVTCTALSLTCGDVADGCGQTLHCGDCTAPEACHAGTCAAVVFVDQTASGKNDGTSWKDAFTTIDQGIAAAAPTWQIWVARGTYKRAATTSQVVVTMASGVEIYGHFAGTEPGLVDRDLTSSNETVLDGESAARVVIAASDARLDGFTVSNGSAAQGAGVYANAVHGLTVSHCRFSNDHASDSGGGVYANASDLILERSVVTSSEASSSGFGGGIYLASSTATLDHCEISHDIGGTGGGLYANASQLTVKATVFDSNQGVYSQSGGGGAFIQSTTGELEDSVFVGNAATLAFGGGIYNETASPRIVNCTFWGNTAALEGLDVFDNVGAVPQIVNSILWSAGSAHVLNDYSGAGPALVTFSDVRGGWTGTGNIALDPSFVNPSGGNLHLAKGSPCIDAADGSSAPATDAADQPRYDDPATLNTGQGAVTYADMGAFEYK